MSKKDKSFVRFSGTGGGNIYNSQLISDEFIETIGFSSFGSINPFISTWRTTSASETIILPYEVAGTYSGTIDWGDNTTSINDYSNRSHTYAVSGDYVVTITGVTTGFRFNNSGDRTKIRSIQNWGTLKLGNNGSYFYGCTNLTLTSVMGTLDLTGTLLLSECFRSCSSLTTINNINSWNTASVTTMQSMFQGCTNFNQALTFNTGAVQFMQLMFLGCTNFNQALNFDTGAVQFMQSMFAVCTNFNQPLNFNTGLVQNMSSMFAGCTFFNSTLTFSSTAKVIFMFSMFATCTNFNQPLNFDTIKVTTMSSMFQGCTNFNSTLTFSNTSLVTTMVSMFQSCTKFNQPLNFDTIGVQTMQTMFNNATKFNQPLTFNTIAVTSMLSMFAGATDFNQNIGSWNVANVLNFINFMGTKTPATFSTANLDAIYNGWSVSGVKPNISISFGGLTTGAKYSASGVLGRAVLTSAPNNWTILDGGL